MVKKDGKVSTNVRDIPESLYEQIKALAEKDKRSINSQIVVLLQEAVDQRSK